MWKELTRTPVVWLVHDTRPCVATRVEETGYIHAQRDNILTGSMFKPVVPSFSPQILKRPSLARLKRAKQQEQDGRPLIQALTPAFVSPPPTILLPSFFPTCNPAISCPGNSTGYRSATCTVLPGQDEKARRGRCKSSTAPH